MISYSSSKVEKEEEKKEVEVEVSYEDILLPHVEALLKDLLDKKFLEKKSLWKKVGEWVKRLFA